MHCFKGEGNGFFGKHHTAEVKEQISASMTGKKKSEEHKKRISAALSGRKFSEEHIRRIVTTKRMKKSLTDEEFTLWKQGYSLEEAKAIIAERKRIEKERIAAEKELERQQRLEEMKRVRENGLSEEDIKMPQVMIMRKYKLKWVELQELMNSYYSKRKWYNKLMSSR